MDYRHIKLTRAKAEKYLEINTKNRVLRPADVAYLKQTILNGEWGIYGEPIRFSGKLNKKDDMPMGGAILLDGQHRLSAFLASGKKSLAVDIIDGMPKDSFKHLDQGRSRSAPDLLSIEGFKNINVTAAVARGLYSYKHGGIQGYYSNSQGGPKRVPNHKILEYAIENEKEIQLAIKQTAHYITHLTRAYSAYATAYCLFRRRSVMDCEKFFYQLGTGEKLEKGSAILALRSIIIDQGNSNQRAKHRGIRPRDLMIILLLAWNAFRDEVKIKDRDELFEFDADNLPRVIK